MPHYQHAKLCAAISNQSLGLDIVQGSHADSQTILLCHPCINPDYPCAIPQVMVISLKKSQNNFVITRHQLDARSMCLQHSKYLHASGRHLEMTWVIF